MPTQGANYYRLHYFAQRVHDRLRAYTLQIFSSDQIQISIFIKDNVCQIGNGLSGFKMFIQLNLFPPYLTRWIDVFEQDNYKKFVALKYIVLCYTVLNVQCSTLKLYSDLNLNYSNKNMLFTINNTASLNCKYLT